MGVSLEHAKFFVPANGRDLCDVQSLLEQPADALVSEIVKAKIVHLCADAKVLEREANRVARHWEHSLPVSALVCLQLLENRDRATRQRNVTRVAILGQGQMGHAANQ